MLSTVFYNNLGQEVYRKLTEDSNELISRREINGLANTTPDAADPSRELYIFLHDCDTLRVYGA